MLWAAVSVGSGRRAVHCIASRLGQALSALAWSIGKAAGIAEDHRHPRRSSGGYGIASSRQAVALGLGSVLFTATGDDADGAELRRVLAETGADLCGVQVLPGPTTKAEVVVCNGTRAVLIDQGLAENQTAAAW